MKNVSKPSIACKLIKRGMSGYFLHCPGHHYYHNSDIGLNLASANTYLAQINARREAIGLPPFIDVAPHRRAKRAAAR